MEGAVANYATWEKYTDGMQIPLGTHIVGTGHATAFGQCLKYHYDPTNGCILGGGTNPEIREVTGIKAPVRVQDRNGDQT